MPRSLYSFWLVPPAGSRAREKSQALIDALADKHSSPSFTPHVTLAGGFYSSSSSSSSTSDATLAARALAASHLAFTRPLRVTLERVSTGKTYHRCVYALARVTPELVAAAAAAGDAALGVEAAAAAAATTEAEAEAEGEATTTDRRPPFKPDDVFMPHLSLLYSSDERAKAEAEREASEALFGGWEAAATATATATAATTTTAAAKEEEAGEGARAGETETEEGSETSWLSSEIEVWLTDGAVETWRLEARVPFGGGGG